MSAHMSTNTYKNEDAPLSLYTQTLSPPITPVTITHSLTEIPEYEQKHMYINISNLSEKMNNSYFPSSISDIKYCLYINLESRKDRREHIEQELKNMGIHGIRFNAVKLENGRIGCSMSHLKCLEIAKKNNWPYVMVCEDDILFLDKEVAKKQMNHFFKLHSSKSDICNVMLLAGNNVPPYKVIDNTCIRVSHCQTTTGYIVKNAYYDTLIHNIKTGIEKLMKNPTNAFSYAIDKYWIQLQKIDVWYLLAPIVAIQREDYSDIEHKKTNYEYIMMDLDKPHLVKKMQSMSYNNRN
jgi:GR25 family glycosyltransferase involved in LPS biosynthesis